MAQQRHVECTCSPALRLVAVLGTMLLLGLELWVVSLVLDTHLVEGTSILWTAVTGVGILGLVVAARDVVHETSQCHQVAVVAKTPECEPLLSGRGRARYT